MLRTYKSIASALVVGFSIFVSSVVASRFGLDFNLTGGPAGFGRNCTVCHGLNEGPGKVEVLGVPSRYQAGRSYDLSVRVTDAAQSGAGFQISAEGVSGHIGALQVSDMLRTQFGGFGLDPTYLMHTEAGVLDSIANWAAQGGSYTFQLRWQAPEADSGRVTFFVSGNAVNNADGFVGDRYYAAQSVSGFAVPRDADGDGDVDLSDVAALFSCFGETEIDEGACAFVDATNDGSIGSPDLSGLDAALTGPVAEHPAGYFLADSVRGGLIYDTWWTVGGQPEPSGRHPLYPANGPRTGAITYRCKECHGWDYKGADGQYATGSHATGIRGVFGTTKTSQEIFDLLVASPEQQPNGHDMRAFGMSDRDLWDAVRWSLEGVQDTDDYVSTTGVFLGDAEDGQIRFDNVCASCHGVDGRELNFGTPADPVYIGTLANENPWEFLHKVRFGHPASPMPSFERLFWGPELAANVGEYSQSLPSE